MSMALNALGFATTEDVVNETMGARPMKGAAWESVLACAQHFGARATLTVPATIQQLKGWTDAGTPVMIAWNPEGREWSHASVVFDVVRGPIEQQASHEVLPDGGFQRGGFYVYVADPNIPNPEKTVRVVHEDDFYSKWYEKWPSYLVRRPACALEREITPEGKQVMASLVSRVASSHMASEVFVDQSGNAHDAEGNTWYVGPQWQGHYFGTREIMKLPKPPMPPRSTPRPKEVEPWRMDRLGLALAIAGDHVALSFVRKNIASNLSEKQMAWVEGLERKYASILRQLPEDPPTHLSPRGGISLLLNKAHPQDITKLSRFFDFGPEDRGQRPMGVKGDPNFPWPSAKQEAPVGPTLGPGRIGFDNYQIQKMAPILKSLYEATGSSIFNSFLRDLTARKGLTEKQLMVVVRELSRKGLREEAQLFQP